MSFIKTMEDLDDFVRGATLYGTGGGGSQEMGKRLLLESFEEKKDLEWVDIDDIPEEDWVCTAFYMGSIAPLTEADLRKKKNLGLEERVEKRVLIKAVEELEKELNINISAIIPVELGGINSPAPVDAAAQMGKKLIDGDFAGRAVPEVAQVIPRMLKYPICPVTCCDAWGNVSILKKTHGYDMAEAIGKMLSLPAFEPIGLACFAMKAKDAKDAVVKGTMTRCIESGRAVREARDAGKDPAQAFADAAKGNLVFKGTVTVHDWESKDGYMYGENVIDGSHGFEGKSMKIWFKNENHLSWIDGAEYIASPDLLQVVDMKTGEPITNTDTAVGMEVAVVAVPNPKYRTEEGIKLLGPEHFDHPDFKYRPMEEIVG